jgi:hypothetical protein
LSRAGTLPLLQTTLAILAALTLLDSQAKAQTTVLSNGVDPITGWLTNGLLIEAINLGPDTGSITSPATVNGIPFTTNEVHTTNFVSGDAYYTTSPNGWDSTLTTQPLPGWPGYYAGTDPDALSLYTNFVSWPNWEGSLTIAFINLTPGQSYQAQVMVADNWNGLDNGAFYVSASTNGGADSETTYVYDAQTNLTSITCTFTAGTNFAQIDFFEDLTYYEFAWSSIFGYTLFQLTSPTLPQDTLLIPANTVYAGTPVTFSVIAGGAPPLRYQWLKNGVAQDATATNSVYILNTQATTNSGNYQCVISNSFGSITSSAVSLTVNQPEPPMFTSLPASATRPLHGQYTLNPVLAGSPPFELQWQLNTTPIPHATNVTLSLTDLQMAQAGNYVLYATNNFGYTNTPPINLTVTPGMVFNPFFGDEASVPSFADWSGSYCQAVIDPTSTYGTCCGIQYYETVYQDTGYQFAPNTLYEGIFKIGLSIYTQYYKIFLWDASGGTANYTNWVGLSASSGSIEATNSWGDYMVVFSTSDNPTPVGHDIGIGVWVGDGVGTDYVTDARVVTNPVPYISNCSFVGPGQFQFTINSVIGRTVNIYISHDLLHWTLLDNPSNVSGADTYIDGSATAQYQYYTLQQQ